MSICSDTTKCPGGNCPGCKGGALYCDDPRCYPNCAGCSSSGTSSSNWIIIIVILILLGIILVMSFLVWYDWSNKSKKASEPKKVTINRHIHNIKPAPLVVPPVVVKSVERVESVNMGGDMGDNIGGDMGGYVGGDDMGGYVGGDNMRGYVGGDDMGNAGDNLVGDMKPVSYKGLNLSLSEISKCGKKVGCNRPIQGME